MTAWMGEFDQGARATAHARKRHRAGALFLRRGRFDGAVGDEELCPMRLVEDTCTEGRGTPRSHAPHQARGFPLNSIADPSGRLKTRPAVAVGTPTTRDAAARSGRTISLPIAYAYVSATDRVQRPGRKPTIKANPPVPARAPVAVS